MLLCDTIMKPIESGELQLSFVSRHDSGRLLGELLCDFKRLVSEYTFGKVRSVVADAGVEDYYLERLRHSHGYSKLSCLDILTSLPLSGPGMEEVVCCHEDNSHSDFYMLFLSINFSPKKVKEIVGRSKPFTIHSAARVTERLVHDRVEIDWNECLRSGNDNLVLLGLSLAGMYHIEEAEGQICEHVLGGKQLISRAALICAVMLNMPPSSWELYEYVSGLNIVERRSVYRMFVRVGYSRKILRPFVEYESECGSGLDDYIKMNMNIRRRVLNLNE